MSKIKPYKRQEAVDRSVDEPVMDAFATHEADGQIPDYVWEDVRLGLEQYERGEHISAVDFLKKHGREL